MQMDSEFLRNIFNTDSIVGIMAGAFILFILILLVLALRLKRSAKEAGEKPVKGTFINRNIATYMPLGLAVSLPLGIAFNNIPLAVAVGPAFGLVLGLILGKKKEDRQKSETRELTAAEKKFQKTARIMLTGLFALGAFLFLMTFFVLQ